MSAWVMVPLEATPPMLDQLKFYDAITDEAMQRRWLAAIAKAPPAPLAVKGGRVAKLEAALEWVEKNDLDPRVRAHARKALEES